MSLRELTTATEAVDKRLWIRVQVVLHNFFPVSIMLAYLLVEEVDVSNSVTSLS
jgi:hypothetical protein